jgi:pilus assembly protein Flp/PilA
MSMCKFVTSLKKLFCDDAGASMVEYGLMVALVAAACVVAVTALGTAVSGEFTTVSGNI